MARATRFRSSCGDWANVSDSEDQDWFPPRLHDARASTEDSDASSDLGADTFECKAPQTIASSSGSTTPSLGDDRDDDSDRKDGVDDLDVVATKGPSKVSLPLDCVTVMVKNLPRGVTQEDVSSMLNRVCFLQLYDFLYVPMLPRKGWNRGLAFINFTTPKHAQEFHGAFHEKHWEQDGHDETNPAEFMLEVLPADVQGLEQNCEVHLQRKRKSQAPLLTRAWPRAPRPANHIAEEAWMSIATAHGTAVEPGVFWPPVPMWFVPVAALETASVSKFCPGCGTEVCNTYLFCVACGSRLS